MMEKKEGNPPENDSKAEDDKTETEKASSRNDSAMMFSFDQSPGQSPRDPPGASSLESTQLASNSQQTESPTVSPRPKKTRIPQDFLTQSSPPKFVSLDEIMRAADGVTNMTLAHEITIDNDFRFKKVQAPDDSLEKRVRDIMHKAFWDVLDDNLREDPPDYGHALVLLSEIKENLMDLLLPHHQRFRAQIDEVLDLDLITQMADKGALDVRHYADFVISIMSKLCAPVRDDEVAALRELTDIVPLFKSIFQTLDVLKLDLANFTIQQMRPYIQQQSIEYERKKFDQLLKQQQENNLDGLEFTKAWLHRAGELVISQVTPGAALSQSASGTIAPPGVSPSAILHTAYMELLQWDKDVVFPETLLLDRGRFLDLCEKMKWLGLVSSILMVTYNTVGEPIAGVRAFKEKLKNDIAVIISETPFDEVSSIMPSVSLHVVKEVKNCLQERGYPIMSPERATLLSGLIESVSSAEQPVHKCLRSRLLEHILKLLATSPSQPIAVPPGFASMAEEFSHVYGQFLRLVTHNQAVFGGYYAEILRIFLKKKVDSMGASE